MSALTSSPPRIGRHPPTDERRRPRPAARSRRRPRVGRRVATAGLLAVLGITLLLSVPALRPVSRAVRGISPGWIAVAVALELASCVSFVLIFRLFFDRVGARDARARAWTEMASGALLPGGGVGGYAIGGWLLHLTGAPTRWIVRRSSGLFFLTSAVNSAAVIGAGLLLLAGAAGPHDFARAAFSIPSVGGLIAYARLRARLTDPSRDDPPSSPSSSLTHASNLVHQEVSHERTPADPQTNRPRMGRLPDRRPGGRSLPWSWFEVACAAIPRQRHEVPAGPGGRQEGGFSANGGHVLAGQRRETVRLGSGSGLPGPAPSHRLGVPRRLVLALLALGCAFSLLAPSHSSASNLVVPREAHARSLRPNHARYDEVPPRPTAAAPSRPDVPSTANGASGLVLLVLALNAAAMLIRLVSSPPSWIKD
jgi:hypothetical protein